MLAQADLVVHDAMGRQVVVVEVVNRHPLTQELAAGVRRHLIEHGPPIAAPYFLVLAQDDGYLWRQTDGLAPDAPPSEHFPMRPVLQRNAPIIDPDVHYGSAQLELIVFQWLRDLVDGVLTANGEPETTLARAGLLDAVRGGEVFGSKVWA
jgi:hypothetical protein